MTKEDLTEVLTDAISIGGNNIQCDGGIALQFDISDLVEALNNISDSLDNIADAIRYKENPV